MKAKLLVLLIFILTNGYAQPQNAVKSNKPRLVVGIVVDQMRADYISRYWNKFGEGGFKRLVKAGYNCRNTRYPYMPTYTGPGHASIYTGTTPALHGIVANDWLQNGVSVYCAQDDSTHCVGCADSAGMMSPVRMRVSTITDELQLATHQHSKVIGIALKDRGAILPAGRMADAAYWFNGKTGNWISSSWYMDSLPQWANAFNERKWPQEYLSRPWNTLLPIKTYTESDGDDSPYEGTYKGEQKPVFPHDLPSLKGNSFDLIRRVPFGNTLTKDFALAAIKGEQLGKDSITDFLCISFSSTDYVGHQFGTNAIETEDTYIRLDRDLTDLLNFLDVHAGKGNYLLFLTADHAAVPNVQSLKDEKLEAGYTGGEMFKDVVRDAVRSVGGNDKYLTDVTNEQIYFNHAMLDADNVDRCTFYQKVLLKLRDNVPQLMDGLTACQLENEEYTRPFRSHLQRGYMHGRSGDILLLYGPAYVERYSTPTGTTHGTPYPYDTHVPLIWYGWNVPSGSTVRDISITDIAPTISFMLNIPLPNTSAGVVINEIVK